MYVQRTNRIGRRSCLLASRKRLEPCRYLVQTIATNTLLTDVGPTINKTNQTSWVRMYVEKVVLGRSQLTCFRDDPSQRISYSVTLSTVTTMSIATMPTNENVERYIIADPHNHGVVLNSTRTL